jgi:MarR family transcriptional regulator, 2-MHQ and catechol-resistance regulon repressor
VTSCPGPDRPPLPGADDPAITTYGRLLEVARRLETVFARTITEHAGMPGPRFELLLRLARTPGEQLTMSELADQLGVTSGGATRLVDKVAADGLVARSACSEDRRVHHVRLTEAGRGVLGEVLAWHRADLARELTDRLTAAQQRQLDALLDLLRDDAPAAAPPSPTGGPRDAGHARGRADARDAAAASTR